MARIASSERLVRISRATKSTFDSWAEGVHIEASTERTLGELRDRAVADRLILARQFLVDGESLRQTGAFRSATSRLYYAMYHTMRAVVYFDHGGDDHEKHTVLPGHTPHDFPNGTLWQNALKDAREHRNAADYDPYPKASRSWEGVAATVAKDARALLAASRAYLRSKGSAYV